MKLHSIVLPASVAAFAMVLGSASAATPATPPTPEGGSTLYCTPASSDFRVAPSANPAPPHAYAGNEHFDASILIKIGKSRRAGTRMKRLKCGEVTIEVRGGYYNDNPQGELGAADDFTKLTIIFGKNRLEVSMLDDSCADAASGRAQAVWGPNPLQAIEGNLDQATGAYQLRLFKTQCDASGNGSPVTQVLNWPR